MEKLMVKFLCDVIVQQAQRELAPALQTLDGLQKTDDIISDKDTLPNSNALPGETSAHLQDSCNNEEAVDKLTESHDDTRKDVCENLDYTAASSENLESQTSTRLAALEKSSSAKQVLDLGNQVYRKNDELQEQIMQKVLQHNEGKTKESLIADIINNLLLQSGGEWSAAFQKEIEMLPETFLFKLLDKLDIKLPCLEDIQNMTGATMNTLYNKFFRYVCERNKKIYTMQSIEYDSTKIKKEQAEKNEIQKNTSKTGKRHRDGFREETNHQESTYSESLKDPVEVVLTKHEAILYCGNCNMHCKEPCKHMDMLDDKTAKKFLQAVTSHINLPAPLSRWPHLQKDSMAQDLLPEEYRHCATAIHNTGQGDCFYKSLSIALHGNESFAMTLKNAILTEYNNFSDELRTLFHHLNLDTLEEVGTRLETERAFANMDICFLASEVCKRAINIVNSNGVRRYASHPHSDKVPPINIFFYENHFVTILQNSNEDPIPRPKNISTMEPFQNVTHKYTFRSKRQRTHSKHKDDLPACKSKSTTKPSATNKHLETNKPIKPPVSLVCLETNSRKNSTMKELEVILEHEANPHGNSAIMQRDVKLDNNGSLQVGAGVNQVIHDHKTKQLLSIADEALKDGDSELNLNKFSTPIWTKWLRAACKTFTNKSPAHVKKAAYGIYQHSKKDSVNAILQSFFSSRLRLSNEENSMQSEQPKKDVPSVRHANKIEKPSQQRRKRKRRVPIKYSPSDYSKDKLYCVCKSKYNPKDGPMVQCDSCVQWFHYGQKDCCDYDGKMKFWNCQFCRSQSCSVRENSGGNDGVPSISPNDSKSKSLSKNSTDSCSTSKTLLPTQAKTLSNIKPAESNPKEDIILNSGNEDSYSSVDEKVMTLFSDGVNQGFKHTLHSVVREEQAEADADVLEENKTSIVKKQSTEHLKKEGSPCKITLAEVAKVLGADEKDLEHTIPKAFALTLPESALAEVYDFRRNKFIERDYPQAFSDAIKIQTKTCTFNSTSDVYYYRRQGVGKDFCRVRGECGGDCEIKYDIRIPHRPKAGKPLKCNVTTTGIFKLKQDKPTGRQIRGRYRVKVAASLRYQKAKTLHFIKTAKESFLDIAHNNKKQHSSDVYRRIKSDANQKSRYSRNAMEDLNKLSSRMKEEHNTDKKHAGYIQFVTNEDELAVYLYDRNSLLLHKQLLSQKANQVTCFIDSTGGMVKKIGNGSQVLSYLLMGNNGHGASYCIAEMLTDRGNIYTTKNFLSHVKEKVANIDNKGLGGRPFCDVIVCDFSFYLLHGIVRGINDWQLSDYMDMSWRVINGEPFPQNRTAINLCCSHMINALSRNLTSKLKDSKQNKQIKSLALHAFARLQETNTLEDFLDTSKTVAKVFGSKNIDQDELKTCVQLLEQKGLPQEYGEIDDTTWNERYGDDTLLTREIDGAQRRQSMFYHKFKEARNEVLLETDNATDKNTYFSDIVLDVLQDYYIPYYMFWSRAITTKKVGNSFMRVSNSVCESAFYQKKNVVHPVRNVHISDYCRKNFEWHKSRVNESIGRLLKTPAMKKPPPDNLKSMPSATPKTHQLKEGWRKRLPKGEARYFSKKNFKDLFTPKQTPKNVAEKSYETPTARNATRNLQRKNIFKHVECKRQEDNITGGVGIVKNSIAYPLEESDIVAKCGPVSLRRVDFEEMFVGSNYLNDQHVMAALARISETAKCGNDFFVSPSYLVAKRRLTDSDSTYEVSAIETYARKEILQDRKSNQIILQPYQTKDHWKLLAIDSKYMECTIYDSNTPTNSYDRKQEEDEVRNAVLKYFFLNDDDDFSRWDIRHEKVQQQNNLWGCGIHLISSARHILQGDIHTVGSITIDAEKERCKIVRELLDSTSKGRHLNDMAQTDEKLITLLVRNPDRSIKDVFEHQNASKKAN